MRKSLPNKDVSHQVRPNTKENYYPELEANKKKKKKNKSYYANIFTGVKMTERELF